MMTCKLTLMLTVLLMSTLSAKASRPWSEGYDSLSRQVPSSSSRSNDLRSFDLNNQSFNQDEPIVYEISDDDLIEEDPEEDPESVSQLDNENQTSSISKTRKMVDAFFNTRLASMAKLKEIVEQRLKLIKTAREKVHELAQTSTRLDMIDFCMYAGKPKHPFYKYGYRLAWLRRRRESMQRMNRGAKKLKAYFQKYEDQVGPRIHSKANEFIADVDEVASWTHPDCMGDFHQIVMNHRDGQAASNYLFAAEERVNVIAGHLAE